MQGLGSKEDTELRSEDLTLSWRELSVEPLGHCQSIGNYWKLDVFSRCARETENPSLFPPLEEQPVCVLLAAWSFTEALNHSAGAVNHCGSCAQRICITLGVHASCWGTIGEQFLPNEAISVRPGALHPTQVIESKQQGLRRLSLLNRCRG